MKETIKSIIEWHEQTFPDATLEGQELKYRDELLEWSDSGCEDIFELADMFIVACGIARFSLEKGLYYIADTYAAATEIGTDELFGAVQEKMQTNRKRKWNKIGNKFQHIEEGSEE